MGAIEDLLNPDKALEKAVEKAVVEELGDVEKTWDQFRAEFRGTDIRPAIRAATNPSDMRSVLKAKLESIHDRATKLIEILEQVQSKSQSIIESLKETPSGKKK